MTYADHQPEHPTEMDATTKQSPLLEQEQRKGDVIVKVAEKNITSCGEIRKMFSDIRGIVVPIVVTRLNEQRELTLE